MIDANNPKNLRFIGLFPRPMPDPAAPYADFCQARGRFSSHNINAWAAPGVQNPTFVAISYFNAGLQVFDISDPTDPKRIAYFVPARSGDINDWDTWRRWDTSVFIEWDRNLIWVGSNEGGLLHVVPGAGQAGARAAEGDAVDGPHLNAGWDDQTPRVTYLGRGLSQLG